MFAYRSLVSYIITRGNSARLFHTSKNILERCTASSTNLSHLSHDNFNAGLLSNQNINAVYDPKYLYNVKPNIIEDPLKRFLIESPRIINVDYKEITDQPDKAISDPSTVVEKQAARLIVIRRRKMKRHKLKKLRIKMKFEWAKVRQRREMRKEKAFHVELMGHIKEAEKFDASRYASEKISKANEVLLPKLWKGKRLPEFVIKDLIQKEEKKKEERLAAMERRKNIKPNVSDYDL